MSKESYHSWVRDNDSYPEHSHKYSVWLYCRHPEENKPGQVFHREFGTFDTMEQAEEFAKGYAKSFTSKGFIRGWRVQPVCVPI